MDGDVTTLADKLVWMPAHQSKAAIGSRFKSDGCRLSSLDYRANRLVDKLALYKAEDNAQARQGEKLVRDVRRAAKVALATLGQVTWAANNCQTAYTDDNGAAKIKICRDSMDIPSSKQAASRRTSQGTEAAKELDAKGKGTTDQFCKEELDTLLRNAGKPKKQAKAKKGNASETRTTMNSTAGRAASSKDTGSTADSVDALCRAAQTSDGSYVSFSSFLAINGSSAAQAGGESQRNEATDTGEESCVDTRPIVLAKIAEYHVRHRPSREKATKRSNDKELSASIKSLLGDPKRL